MFGSKEKLWECGLVGKSDGWVKGKGIEVWSGKGKLPPGSKGKASECGLVGKSAGWVKGKATGVWPGKGKPPPGSKRKPPECGLARENRHLGQRESPRSVV